MVRRSTDKIERTHPDGGWQGFPKLNPIKSGFWTFGLDIILDKYKKSMLIGYDGCLTAYATGRNENILLQWRVATHNIPPAVLAYLDHERFS